jgi:uncharacterized protein (TIGR01244 family)
MLRRVVMLGVALVAAMSAAGCARGPASRADVTRAAGPDSSALVAMLAGTQNASCPLAGLGTGGQPDSARFAALSAGGVRTVIDLRAHDEARGFDEPAVVRAAGLEYVSLPVTASSLNDSTFDAFRGLMKQRRASTVLVHCHSGNRVGAVLIPYLVLDRGWTPEQAIASAEAGGLKTPVLKEKAMAYVKARSPGH